MFAQSDYTELLFGLCILLGVMGMISRNMQLLSAIISQNPSPGTVLFCVLIIVPVNLKFLLC